jgi:hypothetical protein
MGIAAISVGYTRQRVVVLHTTILAWMESVWLHSPRMTTNNAALAIAVAVLLAVVVGLQWSGIWNCC